MFSKYFLRCVAVLVLLTFNGGGSPVAFPKQEGNSAATNVFQNGVVNFLCVQPAEASNSIDTVKFDGLKADDNSTVCGRLGTVGMVLFVFFVIIPGLPFLIPAFIFFAVIYWIING